MERLIGVEAFLKELAKVAPADVYHKVKQIINKLPITEAETVRHGKWIAIEGTDFRDSAIVGFKCTECGRVEYKRQPYCNCGAKME